MSQHHTQAKSHPNTQWKHLPIGKFQNGQRTTSDTAQGVHCQSQQPVVCCNNHRVCIPYNSCRVVCIDDLVEPSQLSLIKFMTLPLSQIDHRNPKSLLVLESCTIYICAISTGTGYQLPVPVTSYRLPNRGPQIDRKRFFHTEYCFTIGKST